MARRSPFAFALGIAIATAGLAIVPATAATTHASTPSARPALTSISQALPPPPGKCTSKEDFDAIFGPTWKPGHAPVPAFYDCLLDYSVNDDILEGGDKPSDYHPPGHLTITTSEFATPNVPTTIQLGLGYPLCTDEEVSNGPSPTPCSLNPMVEGSRWYPDPSQGNTTKYQYPEGASFIDCGQGPNGGPLPEGASSLTCKGMFVVPKGLPLDPDAWFIVEANERVDSANPALNGVNEAEVAVQFAPECPNSQTTCPLKVFTKQLEPLRSGLAIHSVHYKENPVDFTATSPASSSGPSHFACQSGCTDILVSVIDPTTKQAPDPSAVVKASLGLMKMGPQEVSNGRVITPPSFGDGTLCETDSAGNDLQCGTTISGLTTDAKGQVHLRYWAPGVLAEATTILGITATCASCHATPGSSRTTLAEKPYEIYQKSADLPDDDAYELAQWADGPSAFNAGVENSTREFDILKVGVKTLQAAEVAAEKAEEALKAFEAVEPLVLLLDTALKINEAFEAEGMFALFLNDSGLSPFGIGTTPFEASASGQPSVSFVHDLMSQLAIPAFLRAGNGGFWWAAANDIHHILVTTSLPTFDTYQWALSTTVYEVSHCVPANGPCGPGYGNKPGSATVVNGGIEPELVIELSLVHAGVSIEDSGFSLPYDALAWTTTQPRLKGVINDFGP